MPKENMTPRRAAAILLNDYIGGVYARPWNRTPEELSVHLEWNVTEKRYDEIMSQLNKLVEPFRERLQNIIGAW